MRNVPDYNLDLPSTWTVLEKRAVISESEEREFQKGLIEIAGFNPFGQPNLMLRWACDYIDPMSLDGKPKYYLCTPDPVLIGHQYSQDGQLQTATKLEDVPPDKISLPVYSTTHLGERRFIIEQWRSPAFLKKSGRYQQTRDDGGTFTYFACRACGSHVQSAPETINLDIERVCPACGSKRVSPVDIREDGEGQLLRSLPSEGCYDFFLRLQRVDGTYHPPDERALRGIALKWNKEQRSFKEKDAELTAMRQQQAVDARKQRQEIWHPDNMRKNKEEMICQQQ